MKFKGKLTVIYFSSSGYDYKVALVDALSRFQFWNSIGSYGARPHTLIDSSS